MSLVADYSSDSDSDSNLKDQDSSNILGLFSQAKKVKKSSHSGPHKIIVGIPKKIDDYSSDEEIKKENKPSTNINVSSLTFSKLKFKGNGSSLFDMLPPPKRLEEESTEETLISEHSEAKAELPNTAIPKKSVTSFIPFAVKNRTKLQSDLPKATMLKNASSISKPVSTLEESLFPIGNNIQDSYTSEISLPLSNSRSQFNSNLNMTENVSSLESSNSFYYGYDYSTTNPESFNHENNTNLPQGSYVDKTEPLDRLPEDAERFFGGNKKRNRNQPVNILDVDLGKEMNSEEALQARAIRASGAPSTFSSANLDSNSLYKRRHNIVFLAQQARVRENELEERYADNRRTKRETKSKYGF